MNQSRIEYEEHLEIVVKKVFSERDLLVSGADVYLCFSPTSLSGSSRRTLNRQDGRILLWFKRNLNLWLYWIAGRAPFQAHWAAAFHLTEMDAVFIYEQYFMEDGNTIHPKITENIPWEEFKVEENYHSRHLVGKINTSPKQLRDCANELSLNGERYNPLERNCQIWIHVFLCSLDTSFSYSFSLSRWLKFEIFWHLFHLSETFLFFLMLFLPGDLYFHAYEQNNMQSVYIIFGCFDWVFKILNLPEKIYYSLWGEFPSFELWLNRLPPLNSNPCNGVILTDDLRTKSFFVLEFPKICLVIFFHHFPLGFLYFDKVLIFGDIIIAQILLRIIVYYMYKKISRLSNEESF